MGYKDTQGKEKLRFIPRQALVEIARVREYGNNKYGCPNGWRLCDRDDFVEAAMRHIVKYFDGQMIDSESGLPHLSHALTSLALAVSLNQVPNQETLDAFEEADKETTETVAINFEEWQSSLKLWSMDLEEK